MIELRGNKESFTDYLDAFQGKLLLFKAVYWDRGQTDEDLRRESLSSSPI